MARDAGAERPLRLFLALELEAGARNALARWTADAFAGRDELRPVAVSALHVTLVFLGATPPERAPAIWAAASGAAAVHGAPTLTPIGVKGVPSRRPRLFALDLADEADRALHLQGEVEDALGAEGLHQPDARPLWAHVTLARVRRGARAAPLRVDLPQTGPMRPMALVLYRSDRSHAGSRYTALERLELPR